MGFLQLYSTVWRQFLFVVGLVPTCGSFRQLFGRTRIEIPTLDEPIIEEPIKALALLCIFTAAPGHLMWGFAIEELIFLRNYSADLVFDILLYVHRFLLHPRDLPAQSVIPDLHFCKLFS